MLSPQSRHANPHCLVLARLEEDLQQLPESLEILLRQGLAASGKSVLQTTLVLRNWPVSFEEGKAFCISIIAPMFWIHFFF